MEEQEEQEQSMPFDYSNYTQGMQESDVVYQLRGKLKNPVTGKYDIEFQRIMNEKGIALFITQVKASANQITTYSNFRTDEKLIYRLLNKWILDIVYIFYYERKKFVYEGEEKCLIDDEAVVSIIINLATGLMMSSLFKALGAGDRGAVTKTISEMIQRAMKDVEPENNSQLKRKGFLTKMNPFSRN